MGGAQAVSFVNLNELAVNGFLPVNFFLSIAFNVGQNADPSKNPCSAVYPTVGGSPAYPTTPSRTQLTQR